LEKLVFIVDDEKAISKLLTYWVKDKWKYKVETFEKGEDVLNRMPAGPDLILLDIMLPDLNGVEVLKRIKQYDEHIPVIMLSAQGSIEVAVEALRQGAFDYFPKPIDTQRLDPAIKNAIKSYDLQKELKLLKENAQKEYNFDHIISTDKKMQDVFRMVSKVLDNNITVLIHGESGTGKELIARAIHYNGNRKDKPFVVVNCASIPRELLESELFGHEKGSFTGAYQKKIGKFEQAKDGTIFLDEIGDMQISLQAKILRVIQEREFDRVGGTDIIKTDVRIISATNVELKSAVEKKEFREDLFYRLNSFPITIPPLRDRRSDILVLMDHFISTFSHKLNKNIRGFSKRALKYMYEYNWPGNVRELENTVERCMIISDTDIIDVNDLPLHIRTSEGTPVSLNGPLFGDGSVIIPFDRLREESIKHALKVTNGNIVEASRKLHIGRATFYRFMEKYNISPE